MTLSVSRLFALPILALASLAAPARADMAIKDLTAVDLASFQMPDFAAKKEAERLTIVCVTCTSKGMNAIDVHLVAGPADGTEARIRSGETTAATMLEICRDNAAKSGGECYDMKPANLKEAVGFVSDVKINETTYSNTYTLYQDGKLLLMRNVAGSREEAKRLGDLAYRHIAPQVVR